jgi:hypothetical protein
MGLRNVYVLLLLICTACAVSNKVNTISGLVIHLPNEARPVDTTTANLFRKSIEGRVFNSFRVNYFSDDIFIGVNTEKVNRPTPLETTVKAFDYSCRTEKVNGMNYLGYTLHLEESIPYAITSFSYSSGDETRGYSKTIWLDNNDISRIKILYTPKDSLKAEKQINSILSNLRDANPY